MIASVSNTFLIVLCSTSDQLIEKLENALVPFGYRTKSFSDGSRAIDFIRSNPVDVVILTKELTGIDGFMVTRTIKRNPRLQSIPVIFIATSEAEELDAYHIGVDDILYGQFSSLMIRLKVRTHLRLASLTRRLINESRLLEIKVRQRTRQLEQLTLSIVASLERASELHDRETGLHILRVGRYSWILAEAMGLDPQFLEKIRLYAPLHDVGKVGIPDAILKKKAPLTPEEFEIMKKHTLYGYELLSMAKAEDIAKNIALSHHERMDGSGYPFGLQGEAIPLEARIVALADVLDAIVTKRPYKKAMSFEDAVRYILVDSKHLFDPEVLVAMEKRTAELHDVYQSLSGEESLDLI